MFQQIKKSIYGPDFYKDLVEKPRSFSWIYYLKLITLIALVGTILISLILVPKLVQFLNVMPGKVLAVYPAELEIAIAEGVAQSNVTEPYFVDISSVFNQTGQENIYVAVNTQASADFQTLISLNEERTVVALVGRKGVVFREEAGTDKFTYQAFPDDLDLTVNQDNLAEGLSIISRYFFLLPSLLVPFLFIFGLIFMLALSVWLAVVALFLWAVYALAREKGDRFTFGQMYRFTLHAVTLSLIARLAVIVLMVASPGKISFLPFFITVVTILVVIINVPLFGKGANVSLIDSEK